MNQVESETLQAGDYPQVVRVRTHMFMADASPSAGGADSAPDPHDYFDAALATCKALTAIWYAKRHGLPLERVETRVERDNARERAGEYRLRVRVTFHGSLSDEQRAELEKAVLSCPIHKLMTTADLRIETVTT